MRHIMLLRLYAILFHGQLCHMGVCMCVSVCVCAFSHKITSKHTWCVGGSMEQRRYALCHAGGPVPGTLVRNL